jgi:hypothetical protein
VIGGGQLGANWQVGSVVLVIEADIQGDFQRKSTAVRLFRRSLPAALVVELEFRAFAVIARRGPAGGEADGIVGRDFGRGAAITAVCGWPRITEQEDQFAGVLDRIAEIDPIEAEIRERAGCGRLAGFPIDIAGELTDLLAPSDAGRGGRRVLRSACGRQSYSNKLTTRRIDLACRMVCFPSARSVCLRYNLAFSRAIRTPASTGRSRTNSNQV